MTVFQGDYQLDINCSFNSGREIFIWCQQNGITLPNGN